jgi:hypothetical protein
LIAVDMVRMISPLIGPPSLGIVTPITDQNATLDARDLKFFYEILACDKSQARCTAEVTGPNL